jgi:hypothetical protein
VGQQATSFVLLRIEVPPGQDELVLMRAQPPLGIVARRLRRFPRSANGFAVATKANPKDSTI